MTIENFTNFGISIGFFIGSFFAILKFDGVIEILVVTFLISMVMFLIICACGVFILKYAALKHDDAYLEKSVYETILEEYRLRVNKKQNAYNKTIDGIRQLKIDELLEQDRLEQKRKQTADNTVEKATDSK